MLYWYPFERLARIHTDNRNPVHGSLAAGTSTSAPARTQERARFLLSAEASLDFLKSSSEGFARKGVPHGPLEEDGSPPDPTKLRFARPVYETNDVAKAAVGGVLASSHRVDVSVLRTVIIITKDKLPTTEDGEVERMSGAGR